MVSSFNSNGQYEKRKRGPPALRYVHLVLCEHSLHADNEAQHMRATSSWRGEVDPPPLCVMSLWCTPLTTALLSGPSLHISTQYNF